MLAMTCAAGRVHTRTGIYFIIPTHLVTMVGGALTAPQPPPNCPRRTCDQPKQLAHSQGSLRVPMHRPESLTKTRVAQGVEPAPPSQRTY
eukprot:SAG31_NODE_18403_length_637_cov_18.797398_1_plen_90_part_10